MKPRAIAGRVPRSADRQLLVIRVPKDIAKTFSECAQREQLSRSAWARRVLCEKVGEKVSV